MPLMTNRISSLCFNDTSQSQTWNCNILMFSGLFMNVTSSTQDNTEYDLAIGCNQSMTIGNNVYWYGEQPPVISESPMQLVNDSFELQRGPAWFKMISYNKTIILPEGTLKGPIPPPAKLARMAREYQAEVPEVQPRDDSSPYPTASSVSTTTQSSSASPSSSVPSYLRKSMAMAGDRPWVCVWPETFLEVFIYASQNSSFASAPTNWSMPTSWRTSSTATAAPTSFLPGLSVITSAPTIAATPTSGDAGSATASLSSEQASGTLGPIDTGGWTRPPMPYPRVVKLEERRVGNSPPPVCSQIVVQPNHQPAVPAVDDHNRPIVITIAESEPEPDPKMFRRHGDDEVDEYQAVERNKLNNAEEDEDYAYVLRDVEEISECGCMWWIT
jgi:hypothetical protein